MAAEINGIAEARKDAVPRVGIHCKRVSYDVVTIELVSGADGVIDANVALVLGQRQRRSLDEVRPRYVEVRRRKGVVRQDLLRHRVKGGRVSHIVL